MYITKDTMKLIRNEVKKTFPDFKFSIRMRDHSTVCVSLLKGNFDVNESYQQLNEFYPEYYSNHIKNFIVKTKKIIYSILGPCINTNDLNYCDYANYPYHIRLEIGRWNNRYTTL